MLETLPPESGLWIGRAASTRSRPADRFERVKVVAAVDKFRGTATAAEVAAAVGHACWEAGVECTEAPLADGGEGLLEVLGGPNRISRVTGPLGDPVDAAWRIHRGRAVIEMARAAGLTLVGGPEHNDPVAASTTGVGELIDQALSAGASRIVVGLGGSATTDGGFGAVRALAAPARLRGVELVVACDVDTRFTDAARIFGPQKGATAVQIELLTRRLERLAQLYRDEFGVDVRELPGSGAAGGLAGGLAALGANLVSGFELVADEIDLVDRIAEADLVVTGEGHLDDQSFAGKVVGGVLEMAADHAVPVVVVAGEVDRGVLGHDALQGDVRVISLIERFGVERAMREPKACIETSVAEVLATHG